MVLLNSEAADSSTEINGQYLILNLALWFHDSTKESSAMSQIFSEADIEEEQRHFSNVVMTFQQYAQYTAGVLIITVCTGLTNRLPFVSS
jgi:hypothetical protein